jgi:hypothetical protein
VGPSFTVPERSGPENVVNAISESSHASKRAVCMTSARAACPHNISGVTDFISGF